MNDRLGTWARRAVWAVPVYGVLLAVGTINSNPTIGPTSPRTRTTSRRRRSSRPTLIASIAGAAVGLIGVTALCALTEHVSPRRARWGFVSSAFGQIGLASLFGVAAFAQPAIGRAFLDGERAVAETINADVYGSPRPRPRP